MSKRKDCSKIELQVNELYDLVESTFEDEITELSLRITRKALPALNDEELVETDQYYEVYEAAINLAYLGALEATKHGALVDEVVEESLKQAEARLERLARNL